MENCRQADAQDIDLALFSRVGDGLVGVEGYNEHVENSPSANRFRKSRGIAFEQFSDGNLWGSG